MVKKEKNSKIGRHLSKLWQAQQAALETRVLLSFESDLVLLWVASWL